MVVIGGSHSIITGECAVASRCLCGAAALLTHSLSCRGYFFNDTCIRAFSHTHAQGAGLGDGGMLGVSVGRSTPAAPGNTPTDPLDPEPWRTSFAHTNETSVPGYYRTALPAASAQAELTVSGPRAGLHRYTFSAAGDAAPSVLALNACHRTHDQGCGPGSVALEPQGDGTLQLSASLTESGAFARDCGGVPVYLFAVVSATSGSGAALPVALTGLWADGALLAPPAANASSSGKTGSLGAWVAWAAPLAGSTVVVTVRVALSYVSVAAAAANLAAEQQGAAPAGQFAVTFEAAAAAAYAEWDAQLSTVVVNDVGFTDEDVVAYRLGASARGVEPVVSAPGAAARAAELARDAVNAWRASGGRMADGSALPHNAAELAAAAAAAAPQPMLAPMLPLERLGSFYSSLYHAFSAPTAYSDADGAYIGLDLQQHSVTWRGGSGAFYSDLSLWDVYRTQMPLLAVLQPVAASDVFESMMAMFAQTNFSHVPHWVWARCVWECVAPSHGVWAVPPPP